MKVQKEFKKKPRKFKELTGDHKEIKAFCNSEKCSGHRINFGVIKNVPRGTDFCIDCGNALFWSKEMQTGKSEGSRKNAYKGGKNDT